MSKKYLLGQYVRIIGAPGIQIVGAYDQRLGYFVGGAWWPAHLLEAA